MGSLYPTLWDREPAPNTPFLTRVGDPVQFISEPYPVGFDPPAFFRPGTIVSANNQRPEGWPLCAQGPIALVDAPHTSQLIREDTYYLAKTDFRVPTKQVWKTNSTLQAEKDTYADGVLKNQVKDSDEPSRRAEVDAEVLALVEEARMYEGLIKDRPYADPEEIEEWANRAEGLKAQAEYLARTFNRNPFTGAPYRTSATDFVYAPEGEAGTQVPRYGQAQPFRNPYQLPEPFA